jgi:Uma2 family endonuclease
MILPASITTAEQLWAAGDIGRCELIRGELIMMSPTNLQHSQITARFTQLILTCESLLAGFRVPVTEIFR